MSAESATIVSEVEIPPVVELALPVRRAAARALAGAMRAPRLATSAAGTAESRTLVIHAAAHALMTSARTIGFTRVSIRTVAGRPTRVMATNRAGHMLISDITSRSDGRLYVVTAMEGISDGSCHRVLDQHDLELRKRLGGTPPARRSTGGVCDIARLRDAARRFDAPLSPRPETHDAETASRGSSPPRRPAVKRQRGETRR